MSESLSPAGTRVSTSDREGVLLPALASLALVLLPPCARAEAREPVAAIWKERELHFSYQSFMAVHPCHVLQNRIARVLNALGARPDLQVTLTSCNVSATSPTVVAGDDASWPQNPSSSAPGGWPTTTSSDSASGPPNPSESRSSAYWRTKPRQAVEVQVRLSLPAEMTPAVIAELKADRRRRELISRVTGDPLPLFDDPIAFAAQRKVVTLSYQTTGLEPADCELLQQMASSVFKKVGARVVRRSYACDRMYVSHIRPTLDAEALVPVSIRPSNGEETPASGDDQPNPPVSEVPSEPPTSSDADQEPE